MSNSKSLVEDFIQRIVNEEVDKALAVSDKRRKEFQNTFSKVFTEADAAGAPPADQTAAPTAATPAPAPDPTAAPGSPAAPPAGDPNAPATGVDPMAGGIPGAPGTGEPGAEGEEGADATGGDPAGGGGGFGGFGGGGGGGGGGGAGDDTGGGGDDSGAAPEGEPEKPEGDPIEAMVAGAQELLNQTEDPNLILKSLKGQIQTVFQEPEHALGLVKALYDTKDPLLQAVAQRLYLFIKSSG